LPFVEVLGIDKHRRGKPLYHWDAARRAWVADADRWQTVMSAALLGRGRGGRDLRVSGVSFDRWGAPSRYVGSNALDTMAIS
jgi:hypothetical protein